MDQAERAVAVARPFVAGALCDHAHRSQVVDLVELAALLGHLVVDREEVLRTARDVGRHVDLVELLLQHHCRFAHQLFAIGSPLGDHLLDLLVLARMQRLEREVLELPLQRVDTEAMRERRVDLERLACLLELLLLAEILDRAQVVQAVRQLDQDDAQVLGHRDDQLPVVLRLGVLAALELDAGQLRDALDEIRDLVAELRAHLLDVGGRVLDDVVQQRRRERRFVELEPGEDLRDAPGVVDEPPAPTGATAPNGPARRSRTPGSEAPGRRPACTPRPRPAARRRDPGVVRVLPQPHCTARVSDSLPRSSAPAQQEVHVVPMNVRSPMFARRRQTKKLMQVARLLRELDALAQRPPVRRRSRAVLARL